MNAFEYLLWPMHYILLTHVLVLYRIEKLEINLRGMNDAINKEKLQHEHQIEDLHKRWYSINVMCNTVNWEIFNGNKFSRLAESTKN